MLKCWDFLNVLQTGVSEQSSSKSATIEMYAPSSYNETVTGETLSSVSEKSESYSDSNPEYTVSRPIAFFKTFSIMLTFIKNQEHK